MQKQCKYVAKDLKDFAPTPSDRIYFGRYPYKVTLHLKKEAETYVKTVMSGYEPPANFVAKLEESPKDFDFSMAMHLRRMEDTQAWRYLVSNKETVQLLEKTPYYGERFYVDVYNGKLMCYLPNLDYTKAVLNAYGKDVATVTGPWNKKHVDMLVNPNESVAVRSKPYWNKYDIKVSARPSYKESWKRRQQKVTELKEFFQTNTDPKHTRFQRHRYGEVNFWTCDKDLKSIEPFLQLAHPETRLHITRCFSYK